jgi:putative ABC transport system permease protein
MLILLKHILRNIRGNRFRSILIIFALAISTMVLFLNLTIKDDLVKKYTSILQGAFQSFDVMITSNDPDSDGYFDLEKVDLSGIKDKQIFDFSFAYGVYIKDDENLTVSLIGSDRQTLQDSGLCTLEEKSEAFDVSDDNQIIVSKKTAEKYGWKLDDNLTIYTKDGEHKLKITGIAKSYGFFLVENNEIYLMSTKSLACTCAGKAGEICQLMIDLPDNTDLDQVQKTLETANPGNSIQILLDKGSIDSALTMINQLLTIILCLVIGLNIFIIASITKLIMATRIPVVGTFRSVGASKWKMNFILILENAMFGVIGAAIGIAFGVLLRNPISGIFISAGDAMDYLNIKLEYRVSYFVLSILFGIVLQVLVTLSSILKAGRRSIKDNIFNSLSSQARISKKKTIFGVVLLIASAVVYFINTRYQFLLSISTMVLALFGAVLLLPILTKYLAKLLSSLFGSMFGGPARLGMKNISSSKTIRSSITLITVGLSLILMVYGAVNSLNKMMEGANITYDLSIDRLSEPESNYQYIEKLDGINHIQFAYSYYTKGKINEKDAEYIVAGGNHYLPGMEGDEKLLDKLKDNEMLVDEYYAYQNNFSIGDEVTLESKNFKIKEATYKIVGYLDATNYSTRRNVFIITVAEYTKNILEIPSNVEIYANQGQDIEKIKEMLVKKLAGTGAVIQTKEEYLDSMKEGNQSIINMVTVILGLSVLLAIFGLINNQMIGFIQRKREYAVLYSVSMGRAQLRSMIFFESLGTFLTGTAFAFALSQWLIRLLYGLLKSIGMGYQVELQLVSMLQIGGIVLVILLLTMISPVRKISKLNIVNELKYE